MSKPFMTLARTVGVGGLGLALMAPAAAEDLKIAEFDFFRLQVSLGAVESPEVEEDSTDSNGTNTNILSTVRIHLVESAGHDPTAPIPLYHCPLWLATVLIDAILQDTCPSPLI